MASGGINRFYKEKKKSDVGKSFPFSSKDKKSAKSSTANIRRPLSPKGNREDDEAEDRLRQFDLDMGYGPSAGMTRMERWNRAASMDLQPPAEVRDLLLRSAAGDELAASEIPCLWEGRI